MEKMPYQPHLEPTLPPVSLQTPSTITSDWRTGLPCLTGNLVNLREMRASDAPALFAALSSEQVSKFISPPPATVNGFERFVGWAIRQRQAGQYVCFAVVPHGTDTAVGIFQVRSLEPAFGTAEWSADELAEMTRAAQSRFYRRAALRRPVRFFAAAAAKFAREPRLTLAKARDVLLASRLQTHPT